METPEKPLLARNRRLLYKAPNNWRQNQHLRPKILLDQYPDIEKHDLAQGLRNIYNTVIFIQTAYAKLAQRHKAAELTGFKAFLPLLIR